MKKLLLLIQKHDYKNIPLRSIPVYKLISNTGPRHKPLFWVAVKLKDSQFVSASGYSKKDAEQNAASLLLQKVKI